MQGLKHIKRVDLFIIHFCHYFSPEINTDCPSECPRLMSDLATQGTTEDYFISSTLISFSSTSNTQSVSINVRVDNVEEQREYFCLSIANSADRGSQWYTRIIIPWNERKLSFNVWNHILKWFLKKSDLHTHKRSKADLKFCPWRCEET